MNLDGPPHPKGEPSLCTGLAAAGNARRTAAPQDLTLRAPAARIALHARTGASGRRPAEGPIAPQLAYASEKRDAPQQPPHRPPRSVHFSEDSSEPLDPPAIPPKKATLPSLSDESALLDHAGDVSVPEGAETVVRWPVRPSILREFAPLLGSDTDLCLSCQEQLWNTWMHGCCRSAGQRSLHDLVAGTDLILAHAGVLPSTHIADEVPPLPPTDFVLPQRMHNLSMLSPSNLPEVVTPHIYQTAFAAQQVDLNVFRSALWDSQRALKHWKVQVAKVERVLKEAKKRAKIAGDWLCAKLEPWERNWIGLGIAVAALATHVGRSYADSRTLLDIHLQAWERVRTIAADISMQIARLGKENMLAKKLAKETSGARAMRSHLEEESECGPRQVVETMDKLSAELASLQRESSELDQLVANASTACDFLFAEVGARRSRLGSLEKSLQRLHSEKMELEQHSLQLSRQIEVVGREVQERSRLVESDRTKLTHAAKAHDATCLSLENEARRLESECESSNLRKAEVSSALAAPRTARSNSKRTVEDEDARAREAQAREQTVLKEITAERGSWKVEESELQKQLDATRQKASKVQRDESELVRQKKEMAEKIESLTKKKEHLEVETESWKRRAGEDKLRLEEIQTAAARSLEEAETKRQTLMDAVSAHVHVANDKKMELKESDASWARERETMAAEQLKLERAIQQISDEREKLDLELPDWHARKDEVDSLFSSISDERSSLAAEKQELRSAIDLQTARAFALQKARDDLREKVEQMRMKVEEVAATRQILSQDRDRTATWLHARQSAVFAMCQQEEGRVKEVVRDTNDVVRKTEQLQKETRKDRLQVLLETSDFESASNHLQQVDAECSHLRDRALPAVLEERKRYGELAESASGKLMDLISGVQQGAAQDFGEQDLGKDEVPRRVTEALTQVRKTRAHVRATLADVASCMGHASSHGWTGMNDLLFISL